jgi:hypothetical protein
MGHPESSHESPPNGLRQKRRHPLRWVLLGLLSSFGSILTLVLIVAISFFVRLSAGPLTLPPIVTTQIETILDTIITTHELRIGTVSLWAQDGNLAVGLRNIVLLNEFDIPRASLPDIRIRLGAAGLARGQINVANIELVGATLNLTRDTNGSIDLNFSQQPLEKGTPISRALAQIDTFFATTEFAQMDRVFGRNLTISINDQATGRLLRLVDGRMRFDQQNGDLTLLVSGGLAGVRDAPFNISFTRLRADGRVTSSVSFENLDAIDLATAAPAFGWLGVLNAPISGQILADLDNTGQVTDLSARLDIAPGRITLADNMGNYPFDHILALVNYDAAQQRLQFSNLEIESSQLALNAQGYADFNRAEQQFVGQFVFSDIAANPTGVFAAPIGFDTAYLGMRLNLAQGPSVEIGELTLQNEGLDITLSGEIGQGAGGILAGFDARIDHITADQVMRLWPLDAIAQTRDWISRNLLDVTARDVNFAIRIPEQGRPDYALQFDFDDLQVQAVRDMPPITDAVGYVSLNGPHLVVRLDHGVISPSPDQQVDLHRSTMVIEDTNMRGPDARFDLNIEGPLTDILTVLDQSPIGLFDQSPMNIEQIGTGRVVASAGLELPFRQQVDLVDIDFDIRASLRDFRADRLVSGRLLTADEMDVHVTGDGIVIQGRAMFDGVPLNVSWQRALGPDVPPGSRVAARAMIGPDQLGQLGINLPPGMASGQAMADITLDLMPDQPARLQLQSNLEGLGLSIPALSWRLPQSTSGDLSMDMTLGPRPDIRSLRLEGAGLALDGQVSFTPSGTLDRLTANRLQIGRWLDASASLTSQGPGRAPVIAITGGEFDIRYLPQGFGQSGGAGRTPPITIALDRLRVTQGIAFTNLNGTLRPSGGLSGEFTARVNGGTHVQAQIQTTSMGPTVRLTSNDGGGVLRSAGILQTLYGGDLEMTLNSAGIDRTFDARAVIQNPRLRDAPAAAEILNAISVVGLLEQLDGDGINLGQVEALMRIGPRRLVLLRGSAIGPSIGVSLDGTYEFETQNLDMQGVVSPIYFVNGLFGTLTALRNEGLIGMVFNLSGPAQDMNISLNPLSMLTPGILREIFRQSRPDLSEAQ